MLAFSLGASNGQKWLWQDVHEIHNICKLHRPWYEKTRSNNRWINWLYHFIDDLLTYCHFFERLSDVEHSHVRFLGNLVLNLWDCGGQESYMDQYFQSQKENIFRNVEVLIYVFDVESREFDKDMHYYQSCLEAILNYSPDAKIFCLIHKMDLIVEDQRDSIFKTRQEDLKKLSLPLECKAFRTSIWDETLYRAWSSIVYQLIPNVKAIESSLHQFATILDSDEVLLFERATFLVISYCQLKHHSDSHRFEKVSNIIKQFKLSCAKLGAKFQSMEVRNSRFAAFIDTFTSNTYM